MRVVVVRPDVRQAHELAPPVRELFAETRQSLVMVVGLEDIRHGCVLPRRFPETEADGAQGDEGGDQGRQVEPDAPAEQRRRQGQVDLFVLVRSLSRKFDGFCRGHIAANDEKYRDHDVAGVDEPEWRQLDDAAVRRPISPSIINPSMISPQKMAEEDEKSCGSAEPIEVGRAR